MMTPAPGSRCNSPVMSAPFPNRSFRGNSAFKDSSNLFAEKKVEKAHVQIFANDVLMEGELNKKGQMGFQTWKTRIFVLRGQELQYYTVNNGERCGQLKGNMNVRGAKVERVEGNIFSVTLATGSTRVLSAPTIQSCMDWMTAITVASEGLVVDPASDQMLVDHSRNTHIILIRHGHYTSSTSHATDLNGPLTPLGIEQVKRTGQFLYEYLATRMVHKRFKRLPIYHSGIHRAKETAELLSQCFPHESVELKENKLFREAWPGNPLPSTNRKTIPREKLDNMVSDCSRLKLVYRTMFRHSIPEDFQLQENPLTEADKQQFLSIFNAKTSSTRIGDRYRIIVCHANVIRWLICKALGVDPDGTWGKMRYNHCGITAMEVDSLGNVQLGFVNQIGHLDMQMMTESS